jgi:hypothetical protein
MQRLSTATFIPACLALALCGLAASGCAKPPADSSASAGGSAAGAAATPAAPAASPAPATPAAAATTTTATPAAPPPMSSALPIAGGGPTVDGVGAASRRAAAQWALQQDDIKHEADGQWAKTATASSSYADHKGDEAWSAMQATGEPNVPSYADDGHAWAPRTPDSGIEWLDLTYANAVHASEVRVRESMGSGAVVKVEAIDEAGMAHTVWAGDDPTKDLNYLILKFPPTPYKVNRVKVTLATNAVPGWNEIDAVQLVGKP